MRRGAALAVFLLAAGLVFAVRPAAAADVDIVFASGAFTPNPQAATVGDHVFWCNDSDSAITVAVDGDSIGSIAPDDCSDGYLMQDSDIGSYPYTCTSCADPKPGGTLVVQAAPTTTSPPVTATPMPPAPPPQPPATATTRRSTATTRRVTTTTAASTTTSEVTTTTFFVFDTSTSGVTTTTGDLAINTSDDSDSGMTAVLFGSLAVIVLGGGYALWRYRRGGLP